MLPQVKIISTAILEKNINERDSKKTDTSVTLKLSCFLLVVRALLSAGLFLSSLSLACYLLCSVSALDQFTSPTLNSTDLCTVQPTPFDDTRTHLPPLSYCCHTTRLKAQGASNHFPICSSACLILILPISPIPIIFTSLTPSHFTSFHLL